MWFDKVIVATGPQARAVMPRFEGADLFTGRVLHVKAFKRYVLPCLTRGSGRSLISLVDQRSLLDKESWLLD